MAKRSPKAELPELDLRSRAAWRRWLEKHHASSSGIWLVYHKEHTGVASVPYDDSVREALCYGWIDSLIRRLDADRYARKFTPRKAGSAWSESNRKRWAELHAEGALAPAGLTLGPEGAPLATRPCPAEPLDAIERALRKHPRARRFYDTLPPGEQRRFVGWINAAKRTDTRERRRQQAIALLAKGKRLGLR